MHRTRRSWASPKVTEPSRDKVGLPQLALKVDVDTFVGMRDGVPALIETFRRRGISAAFFISCGPDHSGRAIRRVFRKGFLTKMMRTNAPAMYGWRTLLYGTLLPGPEIARSFPELIRALANEHEVGVHGYDHVYWQDRLHDLDPGEVDDEVSRGVSVLGEILGRRPTAFAAPGWQCTEASLMAIDRAGLAYHSDTRGRSPYLPVGSSGAFATPEIPTTWPTLDEVYGHRSTDSGSLVRFYCDQIELGLNVHTIHAEVEGMRHLRVFGEILDALDGRVEFVRLGQVASALRGDELPRCTVAERSIEGRSGTVATQDALEQ